MANERLQIFKCEVCGNIAKLYHAGGGRMICCGQPMKLIDANTVDAAVEKHVPVVEKVDGGIKVTVGSVAHPMEEKHFIEWIEVISGEKTCTAFLKPGEAPEAFFPVSVDELTVREYCNIHGLWKA